MSTTTIRIRQTSILEEILNFLKSTKYQGLDNTEIIRAVLAETAYNIKKDQNLTQEEIEDIIQSRKQTQVSKNNILKTKQDIKNFVANLL
jgi:CHASE3 domain sensor protein